MFEQNDICEPSSFADCTGCPKAQWVFHQFNPSTLGYFLQVANLVIISWLLYFVNSLGCLIIATVFGDCYAGNRRAEDLYKDEIWISFKTTCRYHLGTAACAPLIQLVCCHGGSLGYVFTALYGDSLWEGWRRSASLLDNHSAGLKKVHRVTRMLFFITRLCLAGVAVLACFVVYMAHLSTSVGHLNYQIVPIIIIMCGVFILTSGLFSLHGVAVDTLLVCWAGEWENRGQGNNVSAPKNMERLFGMSEEMVGVDNPISMDIIEGE